MKEYYVRFWGGAEEAIAQKLGTNQRVWYFPSQAERESLLVKIKPFSHLGLVMDLRDGELTHMRTVASVVFKYKGHTYVTQSDFGPEYPTDSVRYMYQDGNYCCDCNRSTFIREVDPGFPALDCGHEIEMTSLQIAHKPL